MNLFDSHAHYNDKKFDEDRDEIIKETLENDVSNFIVAGYNIESSKIAIEIANQYKRAYAIVGISPNDLENIQTKENIENNILKLEDIVRTNLVRNTDKEYRNTPNIKNKDTKKHKIVAIGEIGLDYYWNKENKEIQKEMFIKQIGLANKLGLPIVIHTREAVMDTISILKQNEVNKKGVFPMETTSTVTLQDTIETLLKSKKYATLRDILTTMNPVDIAAIFEEEYNKELFEEDE